jgi:hypothetical protein
MAAVATRAAWVLDCRFKYQLTNSFAGNVLFEEIAMQEASELAREAVFEMTHYAAHNFSKRYRRAHPLMPATLMAQRMQRLCSFSEHHGRPRLYLVCILSGVVRGRATAWAEGFHPDHVPGHGFFRINGANSG